MTTGRDLSVEAATVFRTAGTAPGAATVERLTAGPVDWPRLLWLAEHELATASLWRALAHDAPAPVPPAVAEYLARSTTMSDFRMQHLSGRLQESVRALGAHHVRVLLLKGAAVGALSDATFRSRPMNDLDLLVRPDDVPRARAALLSAGWTASTDPTVDVLLADHHHLPPFLDPRMPGIRLELHVSTLPPEHPFALPESEVWAQACEAPAPFAGALLPSAEHLLLHTCVHFAWSHAMSFGAWRTIRSVAVLVGSGAVDWEAFVALARASRGATACYWTLRLSSALGGIELPASVLPRLAAPSPEFVRRALERHFITTLVPGEGPPSPSVRLSRLLWVTALRPRWSGHRTPGRLDTEQRWGRAMGTFVAESPWARSVRHLRGIVPWWRFLVGTLLRSVARWPRGRPTPR